MRPRPMLASIQIASARGQLQQEVRGKSRRERPEPHEPRAEGLDGGLPAGGQEAYIA